MHSLDRNAYRIRWRVLGDAVAQIKYMPSARRYTAKRGKRSQHLCLDLVVMSKEHVRIKIALEGTTVTNSLAGEPQMGGPIKANAICTEA
jgi:hypothetical protein